MARLLVFVYGVIAYSAFLGAFLYLIGFVGDFAVPKSIDSGAQAAGATAILVDALLVGVFAVQHTIMARPGFKTWWTRVVPAPMERSTFVLIASLLLGLLYWQWCPLHKSVWLVEPALLRGILTGLSFVGWGIVLYSSFLIDHFDLFGLRQVTLHLRGRPYRYHPFVERSLYRIIRHPLMAGFLIAFWATPTMTEGHLLFAGLMTAYVLFGIRVEEKDLLRMLGEDYRHYRARTPMLIPGPRRPHAPAPPLGEAAGD